LLHLLSHAASTLTHSTKSKILITFTPVHLSSTHALAMDSQPISSDSVSSSSSSHSAKDKSLEQQREGASDRLAATADAWQNCASDTRKDFTCVTGLSRAELVPVLCRLLLDLQRQVDAIKRRRSILTATAHAIEHMDNVFRYNGDYEKVEWSLVDVNLTLSDGRRFHTMVAASLRARATAMSSGWFDSFTTGMQVTILNKMLEYAPTSANLQPEQPRDADELLQWMALELAVSCNVWLSSFIQQLVTTLHDRGFDLNRCSRDGRTLLTVYASALQRDQTVAVECQLMRLDADASQEGKDGISAIAIWIDRGYKDLVESVLIDTSKVRYPGLNQPVDLWERDAEGRTLLECMQAQKSQDFAPCIAVLKGQLQHWTERERPLLQSMQMLHASLIPDLARMVLDYVDGGAEAQ
jgi:hypothetical protein